MRWLHTLPHRFVYAQTFYLPIYMNNTLHSLCVALARIHIIKPECIWGSCLLKFLWSSFYNWSSSICLSLSSLLVCVCDTGSKKIRDFDHLHNLFKDQCALVGWCVWALLKMCKASIFWSIKVVLLAKIARSLSFSSAPNRRRPLVPVRNESLFFYIPTTIYQAAVTIHCG